MTKKADKVLVKNRNVRLTLELLETARDMHASGLLTDVVRDKITMHHLGGAATDCQDFYSAEMSGPGGPVRHGCIGRRKLPAGRQPK
jgi:hypothetical protein